MIGDKYTKFNGAGVSRSTATLMKTGQLISYRTGDDGDLEAGRDVDFFTLAENNPFGNTNRFTDVLGGQTYANNIVIDWSTYNGNNVLGYRRILYDDNVSWNNAIDFSLTKIIGGFSGWRLVNRIELNNIANMGVTTSTVLSYEPFNITTNLNIWTSTTSPLTITNAFLLGAATGNLGASPKTTNGPRYMVCRTFTVTGITLS